MTFKYKIFITIIITVALMLCISCNINTELQASDAPIAIAIHGGAGYTSPDMPEVQKQAYIDKLNEALTLGYEILSNGGSSMDAVEKTIRLLEDSPLFNAGKGSVFTAEGKNELDASIMDGKTGMAGAIAGVRTVKNPISLARKVMEETPHVMLSGEGAEIFAKSIGLEIVDPSYFYTERRWNALQNRINKEKDQSNQYTEDSAIPEKFGTVGVAALDKSGNLAAGTSTGGMTYKKYGRIGDAPIIGAGTYANNNTCAVSATGHGEYFIRNVVAYDISAKMMYQNKSLNQAATEVVMQQLVEKGGNGGIISVDKEGNVSMPFNTPSMFRASIDKDKNRFVGIFKQ